MSAEGQPHISVMLPEVLDALAPQDGGVYLDGTFGAGGYSKAVAHAANCHVIGVDRDPLAHEMAVGWLAEFDGRIELRKGCFGSMDQLENIPPLDGVMLDIGVSSMQLDMAERGFSYAKDGPLDMRMEGATSTLPSAADVVANMEETDLANIIYKYGEERHSRRVAKAIIRARTEARIETTAQFADIVRGAVPYSKKDKSDRAARTFQALRIFVNDELGELERGMEAALRVLKPGGRLVVVTFHSLEDRIVKNFMRDKALLNQKTVSRFAPELQEDNARPLLELAQKKAILASEDEIKVNPRSRSAKLRYAIRTDVPYYEMEGAK
ncbi:MAG: 16S rRNA (cytosine(1402)-N(4))-methyltransferase RsmH [Alphaproteobacteria bacterium]|nr:16S rRNA (cytosine(1402)-N(4))-methyltransferase RsmH [Alphaproteobacteria bacterium]